MDRRDVLSSLWLFVLLNVIFRDIHELLMARTINEILTGRLNGTLVTDDLMLIGAFIVEIPIAMVLFSRILPYAPNRWANAVVAPLVFAGSFLNAPNDPDDVFFLVVQLAALAAIAVVSWAWRENERTAPPDYPVSLAKQDRD